MSRLGRYGASRGSITCPTPHLCKARAHVSGTTAYTKCLARSRRTTTTKAPPGATPPRLMSLEPATSEDWTPGTIHPTGGYDQVVHQTRDGHSVPGYPNLIARTIYLREGKMHREDGPAEVGTDYDDYAVQGWYQDGVLHRGDGPAVTGKNRMGREYWYRGTRTATSTSSGDSGKPFWEESLLESYLAAGADRERATGYLKGWDGGRGYHCYWSDLEVAHLSQHDIDPARAIEARQAGVEDPEAIVAVASGEMPLSWAAAGA